MFAPTAIRVLDKARIALAESRTLSEVKKIRNIAQAARTYAKAAHLGRARQNEAAELKLLAERKAGDFLAKMERAKPKPTGGRVRDSEYRQALRDTNTTERTAERWQRLAAIPENAIDDYIAAMQNTDDGEITTAGLVAFYGDILTVERREERVARHRTLVRGREASLGCGGKIGPFDCCSIVCGDAHELLPRIPDESVAAVITDPPYGLATDEWDGRVPYEMVGDFHRVARGPVVWFGSAPKILEAARAFDPSPERVLIWAPSFTLSHVSGKGIAYRYHPIYVWRLPKKHEGPVWDVLNTNTESGNWWFHPCSKPVALMAQLCQLVPENSVVLDPFAGSGATLVAAQATGRHFLGFESHQGHVTTCEARLREQLGEVSGETVLWQQP